MRKNTMTKLVSMCIGLLVCTALSMALRPAAAAEPTMTFSPPVGPVTTAAAQSAGFKTLDLRSVVTLGWKDDRALNSQGGWTRQAENDMRYAPPGLHNMLGVPFDLIDPAKNDGKAVLTLRSAKFRFGPLTATATVGAKAASLYFLHASAWTGGEMATYIVTYDDGTAVNIPIRAGEEINEWWEPQHGKQCRVAFQGPNGQHDNVGMFAFGWNNPHPEKTIKTLEFKSANQNGIVIIAAVTLSDKPAALPDAKDIPAPDFLKPDTDLLDKSQWFTLESKADPFGPTCIDQLANLDAPAGKHGFQKTVNGKWVYEDGTPSRMVATMTNPPETKEQAVALARCLAKYGFTMVRMGHFVTGPDENGMLDWKRPDTQHLNAAYLDRLDFFINELAKNGVYSRLSTFWYRKMKRGDTIDGFDEAVAYIHKRDKTAAEPGKEDYLDTVGITFFHPRVMELNIELEKAIMTHKNPYRDNKMYGADPAICQIEVTNEDGVFFATFDGLAPVYGKMLNVLWIDWLKQKYGTDAKLLEVWGQELGGNESLADGTVGRLSASTFGPKLTEAKPHRVHDQIEFMTQVQNGYFTKFKQAMRAAGVKQPICGSGWFGGGTTWFADILSNAQGMDYIDRHHYWGGGPGGWQILNLNFTDECAMQKPELILKLGGERVIGMPYTISEWANTLPNQYRLEAPPLMAFYGYGLNRWDAPIHFAWEGNGGFTPHLKWMWPVNEPSTLCQYPALSNMIRHGDIKEGPDAFIRNLSDERVYSGKPLSDALIRLDISGPFEALSTAQGVNPRALAATYATAVGRTGVAFTGKDEKPDQSLKLDDYLNMEKKEIRSATGELYWNYDAGYVTANAPRMQAAVGFYPNLPIKLADCQIQTSTIVASVLVSPLDDQSLRASKHVLITAVGRTRNADMLYSRNGKRVLDRGDRGPLVTEGIKGSVSFPRAGKCTVTALDPYGYKTVDVQPRIEGGQIVVPLDGQNKATYYEVTFE